VRKAFGRHLSLVGIAIAEIGLLEERATGVVLVVPAVEQQLEGRITVFRVLGRGDTSEVGELLDGL
jgi:hypothetical protein